MESIATPCGYEYTPNMPDAPSSQTLQERLSECSVCIKMSTCGYPKSISLKMVKNAIEEPQAKPTNLYEIASTCHSFAEFTQKADKLDRTQDDDKFFKALQEDSCDEPQQSTRLNRNVEPVNLYQIARSCLGFGEFRSKAERAIKEAGGD